MNTPQLRRASDTGASLCLTDDEVTQLTGKSRPSAQMRALKFMAIDHKRRPDGSIVVLRSQLGVGYGNSGSSVAAKRTQPNWN